MEYNLVPGQFKSHIALPDTAATILQRNPGNFEERVIKPKAPFIRTGGYTPGLYAGRSDVTPKEQGLSHAVSSLSEAKIVKSREFAE